MTLAPVSLGVVLYNKRVSGSIISFLDGLVSSWLRGVVLQRKPVFHFSSANQRDGVYDRSQIQQT
jgi:hypothetical protein